MECSKFCELYTIRYLRNSEQMNDEMSIIKIQQWMDWLSVASFGCIFCVQKLGSGFEGLQITPQLIDNWKFWPKFG